MSLLITTPNADSAESAPRKVFISPDGGTVGVDTPDGVRTLYDRRPPIALTPDMPLGEALEVIAKVGAARGTIGQTEAMNALAALLVALKAMSLMAHAASFAPTEEMVQAAGGTGTDLGMRTAEQWFRSLTTLTSLVSAVEHTSLGELSRLGAMSQMFDRIEAGALALRESFVGLNAALAAAAAPTTPTTPTAH